MITLYRTKLSPERNALVDDLDQYLNRCEKEGPIECQYIKHGLDVEIKLDLPQDILSHPVYNYVAIQNENDSLVYYYFIMDMKWTAKSTVRLVLSIDSVNTFRDRLEWSEKTNVLREHRDRMVVSAGANYGRRIIDEVDEGIVPLQLLSEDRVIAEHQDPELKWYLMYKTKDELAPDNISNPISCYAFASKEIPLSLELGQNIITPNDLETQWVYYCTFEDNGAGQVKPGIGNTITLSETTRNTFVFFKESNTKIGWYTMSYDAQGSFTDYTDTVAYVDDITFIRMLRARERHGRTNQLSYINAGSIFPIQAGDVIVQPLSQVDRTDSRIMKIIELPYAPFEINHNSATGEWTIPEGWEYYYGAFRLKDLNSEFKNSLLSLYLYEFTCDLPYAAGDARLLEVPHDSSRESKLYNSNFYTYKLAYDNFYSQVAFERFRNLQTATPTLMIEFKPTNTINSNMMFKWKLGGATYKKIADYEEYIPCNRNNEISIFSNDYVNYIRTGYNYDKKIKNWSTAQRWVGQGTSLVSTGALAIAGKGILAGATAATGGVAALIAGGAAIIGQIWGNVVSQVQAEQSFESKLSQLAAQSSTVSGSDDIDLLNYYNGNKLHSVIYQPTDRMRETLYDLFRYTGYATNVQKIPDLNSRCRYNFVQCEAKFLNEDEDVLKPYVDDIKSRYASGITVYHNVDFTWDWDQVYENWENSIIYPF